MAEGDNLIYHMAEGDNLVYHMAEGDNLLYHMALSHDPGFILFYDFDALNFNCCCL
jgi:hypothetical protein